MLECNDMNQMMWKEWCGKGETCFLCSGTYGETFVYDRFITLKWKYWVLKYGQGSVCDPIM